MSMMKPLLFGTAAGGVGVLAVQGKFSGKKHEASHEAKSHDESAPSTADLNFSSSDTVNFGSSTENKHGATCECCKNQS